MIVADDHQRRFGQPVKSAPSRIFVPHPPDEGGQFSLHFGGGQTDSLAVARQHPYKPVAGEPLHRLDLLRPRIPAVVPRGTELLPIAAPEPVVSREKKPLPEQKHAVALGMAGRWNRGETGCQFTRFFAFNHGFGAGLGGQFGPMNEPAASKTLHVPRSVGYVVAVGEEHVGDAAQGVGREDEPAHGPQSYGRQGKKTGPTCRTQAGPDAKKNLPSLCRIPDG